MLAVNKLSVTEHFLHCDLGRGLISAYLQVGNFSVLSFLDTGFYYAMLACFVKSVTVKS